MQQILFIIQYVLPDLHATLWYLCQVEYGIKVAGHMLECFSLIVLQDGLPTGQACISPHSTRFTVWQYAHSYLLNKNMGICKLLRKPNISCYYEDLRITPAFMPHLVTMFQFQSLIDTAVLKTQI